MASQVNQAGKKTAYSNSVHWVKSNKAEFRTLSFLRYEFSNSSQFWYNFLWSIYRSLYEVELYLESIFQHTLLDYFIRLPGMSRSASGIITNL